MSTSRFQHSWRIGELKVHRVEELCEPVFPVEQFLQDLPADAVMRNLDWLVPNFIEPTTMRAIMSSHAWVIQTPHHNMIIDTCWGNDKPRDIYGGNFDLPWLDRLGALGLTPEDIDFVMCTHLHADHIGWNTRLLDGRWVPTFPNARYLFGRKEFDYWSNCEDNNQVIAFEDSVLPCIEAGLATLVDNDYAIDDTMIMEDAPGHTAGNMVVRACSNGMTGIFSGDVFHVPIQFRYPDVNSIACSLPEEARATRRRLLDECAEHGHLLLPGHFPAPFAGRAKRDQDAYLFITD
jgi:glyoxylase-like metal-dependent hydrolase (beta-lactamase superfamily II)